MAVAGLGGAVDRGPWQLRRSLSNASAPAPVGTLRQVEAELRWGVGALGARVTGGVETGTDAPAPGYAPKPPRYCGEISSSVPPWGTRRARCSAVSRRWAPSASAYATSSTGAR